MFYHSRHCSYCGHDPDGVKKVPITQPVADCGAKKRTDAIWIKLFFAASFLAAFIVVFIWRNDIATVISLACLIVALVLYAPLTKCPYCRRPGLRLIPIKRASEFCGYCGNEVEYKD